MVWVTVLPGAPAVGVTVRVSVIVVPCAHAGSAPGHAQVLLAAMEPAMDGAATARSRARN